jgi:hypothetical protein
MQTDEDARRLLKNPLDHPSLVKRPRASQKARLWRSPSFDPESSWTILADSDGWFVRRMAYAPRYEAGVRWPYTYGSEAPLPAKIATALLQDLYAIRLPPFVEIKTIGLDGARYGVETGAFWNHASLSWWGAAPEGWSPLRDWYGAAVRALESCLPSCTVTLQQAHPWVE